MGFGIAAAAIGAVGAVGGALISSAGASSAANTAANASTYAANLDQQRYNTTRSDLMPYNAAGQNAVAQMPGLYTSSVNNLNSAYAASQAAIPKTITQQNVSDQPGYQFALSEGMKALNNQYAGSGQSNSGNAARAALNFGTGLASQGWQNYFNNAQTQYTDTNNQFSNAVSMNNSLYSQLSGTGSLGENAAAQTGSTGAALTGMQGTNIANAGQQTANGITNTTNALGSAVTGLAQTAQTYAKNNTSLFNSGGSSSYSSLDPNGTSVAPASYNSTIAQTDAQVNAAQGYS